MTIKEHVENNPELYVDLLTVEVSDHLIDLIAYLRSNTEKATINRTFGFVDYALSLAIGFFQDRGYSIKDLVNLKLSFDNNTEESLPAVSTLSTDQVLDILQNYITIAIGEL